MVSSGLCESILKEGVGLKSCKEFENMRVIVKANFIKEIISDTFEHPHSTKVRIGVEIYHLGVFLVKEEGVLVSILFEDVFNFLEGFFHNFKIFFILSSVYESNCIIFSCYFVYFGHCEMHLSSDLSFIWVKFKSLVGVLVFQVFHYDFALWYNSSTWKFKHRNHTFIPIKMPFCFLREIYLYRLIFHLLCCHCQPCFLCKWTAMMMI